MPKCTLCGSPCDYAGLFGSEGCTNRKCKFASVRSSNAIPQESLLHFLDDSVQTKLHTINFLKWVAGDTAQKHLSRYEGPVLGLWHSSKKPKYGDSLIGNCHDLDLLILGRGQDHWELGTNTINKSVAIGVPIMKSKTKIHYKPAQEVKITHIVVGVPDHLYLVLAETDLCILDGNDMTVESGGLTINL